MNAKLPDNILTNPSQWPSLTDEQWVALHAPRFADIRPRYVAYEDFLKKVLKQACRKLAPLAIIEARAKGIPSFAEKTLRKKKLYTDPKDPLPPDPLIRMTDLCGGRIIAQTSEQVRSVCRFIEAAFEIDWPNSEDVSQRLKPTEFGYRSVHYIVMVDPKKLAAAGINVPVPKEVLGLKAEIQVRTMLEHASADIGHDLLYKTEVKVPDRLRRLSASLAAVLEGVDREFGRLVDAVSEFKSNYGAYHSRKEVASEIEKLRIVLSCAADNTDLAVKIAQLALSIGNHELALEILQPYAAQPHQGVQRVRGLALTEMHWDQPRSKEYRQGRESLAAACAHERKDAETFCTLAESWARDDEAEARKLFREAVAVDATEPVTLARYIEFEVAHVSNDTVVRIAAPVIRNSMDRCRKQIEGRVNLPWAWSSLAMFHLLVDEPFEALNAVAHVIRLCEESSRASDDDASGCGIPGRPCASGRALLRMRESLKRLACIKEKLRGHDWCERAVMVGLAACMKDEDALEALRKVTTLDKSKPHLSKGDAIVMLTGATAAEFQGVVDAFKPCVLRACEGLSFAVLSGGTTPGISGLAGDMAEQSKGKVRAFGYLPANLPRGIHEDTGPGRYIRNFNSTGADFTPLDPLQAWTDAIVAGIDPHRVKLLSYGSGKIGRAECAMALALGARVGVMEDPALPKDRQFHEPDWQDCSDLARLPMDAMTLRAFLLVNELPRERPEFEKAAQKTHEEYVKSAIPKEPSLLAWDDLPSDLKLSNFHQVAYAENILKTAGLGICKITDPAKPPLDMAEVLGEDGIRRLAEMEHGRWNVERLLLGWHYAEKKDVLKKLSPYLVPWEQVPKDIQKYDLDAIRKLPEKFKEAGMEVYKL